MNKRSPTFTIMLIVICAMTYVLSSCNKESDLLDGGGTITVDLTNYRWKESWTEIDEDEVAQVSASTFFGQNNIGVYREKQSIANIDLGVWDTNTISTFTYSVSGKKVRIGNGTYTYNGNTLDPDDANSVGSLTKATLSESDRAMVRGYDGTSGTYDEDSWLVGSWENSSGYLIVLNKGGKGIYKIPQSNGKTNSYDINVWYYDYSNKKLNINYSKKSSLSMSISSYEKGAGFTSGSEKWYKVDGSSSDESDAEYAKLVKNYVSSSYSYADFYIKVSFNSTLKSHLNKNITYGIIYGYDGIYSWNTSCTNFSGTTGYVEIPIFFDSGNYKFSINDFYASSWLALMKKKKNGEKWSDSENDLFNDIKPYVEKESVATSAFTGKVYAEIDGIKYYFSEINGINGSTIDSYSNTDDSNTGEISGKLNGYEWIDLGLSVKWATCNIGASTASAIGSYYAWGETYTRTDKYTWTTYKYGVYGGNVTKYTGSDKKYKLESSDDAATQNWGDGWRMPTKSEFLDLVNKCTWTWTAQNGTMGYKVTGKNGNSIFLPAGGYKSLSNIYDNGTAGYYWTSSLDTQAVGCAYGCIINSSSYKVTTSEYTNRYRGFTVRPVCTK